jgi:hypothetical protein
LIAEVLSPSCHVSQAVIFFPFAFHFSPKYCASNQSIKQSVAILAVHNKKLEASCTNEHHTTSLKNLPIPSGFLWQQAYCSLGYFFFCVGPFKIEGM